MKLLVISHLFPNRRAPNFGIFVLRQLGQLQQLGVQIDVISPVPYVPYFLARLSKKWRNYYEIERFAKLRGIDVFYVRYLRPPGKWFRPFSGLSCFVSVFRFVRKNWRRLSYDVILANMIIPDGEVAFRLGRRYKLASFCYAIGDDINIFPYESIRSRKKIAAILSALDGVIAHGESIRDGIKRIARQAKQVEVIYRGCDLEQFKPDADRRFACRATHALDTSQIVCLYVGFLIESKGLNELVEAFAGILPESPKVHLWLAGDGDMEQKLLAWKSAASYGDQIKLLGSIAHDALPPIFNAADLFVFPSHNEGIPNAVVEAAATGLPIIGTRIPGILEILGNEYEPILVSVKNPAELQQRIEYLLQSPQERQRLAGIALHRARQFFDAKRNAHSVLEFIFKDGIKAA